jgi:hypothetical protein
MERDFNDGFQKWELWESGPLGVGQRPSPISGLKILQRLSNLLDLHRVNLQSTPDVTQQGDGEFSAEVFAEFLQPLQHPQLARSGYGLEFGIKQSKPQPF